MGDKELYEVVNKYLKANGIKCKRFAEYIGCEYVKATKWLNGKEFLTKEQLQKARDFLDGKYLITVDDILNK